MKLSRTQNNKQSKQGMSHLPKPQVRDDLDSRQNKEGFTVVGKEKGRKNGKKSTQ